MRPPRAHAGHHIAIVDPLTVVGKELRRVLADSALPLLGVYLHDRPERAGAVTEYAGEPALVTALDESALDGADVFAFCGAADLLAEHAEALRARGVRVLDLSDADALPGAYVVPPGVGALPATAWLVRPPSLIAGLLASWGRG